MAPEESVFPSTIWGEIRPGSGGDEKAEANALEVLARRYSNGIVAFLRVAMSRSPEDARDLAQDFFVWMIETGFLKKADPTRGRFRAFLKTALRHYAADDRRKRAVSRRGGDRRFVPLASPGDGDDAPPIDPPDGAARTPGEALDAAWRSDLVRRAIESLEADLRNDGRDVTFAVFREYFLDPDDDVDYRAIGERHGLSAAEVSNHLQRAKAQYRARLKALVLDTVHTAEDLEEELRFLFGKGGGT